MNSSKPKRVVSKAEYARIMARNAILTTVSICCMVFSLANLILVFLSLRGESQDITFSVVCFGVFLLFSIFAALARRTRVNVKEVYLATRQSVESLPTTDILLRSSDAPQTLETVLLRAAQETETPQEQLLRPS